jgi:hypothetical protein
MQNDLYFTRAIGGSLTDTLRRAVATTYRESRGFGRIKVGTSCTRSLACILAAPISIIYAYPKRRLYCSEG